MLLLYADDLVLIRHSPAELQHDLDALYTYCQENHLTVSIGKTKCLAFYRGRFDNRPAFHFGPNLLENVKEFKYLGITFTTQLSATKHVQNILSKCNSRIAQLFFKLKVENSTLPRCTATFQHLHSSHY